MKSQHPITNSSLLSLFSMENISLLSLSSMEKISLLSLSSISQLLTVQQALPRSAILTGISQICLTGSGRFWEFLSVMTQASSETNSHTESDSLIIQNRNKRLYPYQKIKCQQYNNSEIEFGCFSGRLHTGPIYKMKTSNNRPKGKVLCTKHQFIST